MSNKLIIIPTLNEKENIRQLVPAILALLPEAGVLVVDDNSSDGTSELVSELGHQFSNCHLLKRNLNFGYGRSVADGFRWAIAREYDQIVTMDADFSHDYQVIPNLLKGLDQADVVVGSRYIRDGHLVNWAWHRKLLSWFANKYVVTLLGIPAHDATSGFVAYRRSALATIDFYEIHSDGYAFLIDLKYRLYKNNCSFIEVPITFTERREGQSKMSFKIIWEAIWLPWRLLLRNKP